MKLRIYNRQKDFSLNKAKIRAATHLLCKQLDLKGEELAIYFVSEQRIASLHEQFFQDPSPTDCITFPLLPPYLGEIFICPRVAMTYAEKKELNPRDEILLYLVHGLLHLAGFDDQEPHKRSIMRKKEKSCMHHLKAHKVSL